MCVALVTKPGAVISEQAIERGWRVNPDGGGFAYVRNDKVVIEKGFMTLEEFDSAYRSAAALYARESPFLVHMRISTSGGVSTTNCHPFEINGGAMIHNGIMFTPTGVAAGTISDRKSDTRVFCEQLFHVLKQEHLKLCMDSVQREVGYGNKLCFLYDNKEYLIIGERSGTWDNDGIWHSNSSCQLGRRY